MTHGNGNGSTRHRHRYVVCDDSCCEGRQEWCEDANCGAMRPVGRLVRLGLRWPIWNVRQLVRHGSW